MAAQDLPKSISVSAKARSCTTRDQRGEHGVVSGALADLIGRSNEVEPKRRCSDVPNYPTVPATLLSLVNPSLGVRELKTADRTLMSHSNRGQALIESRLFEKVCSRDQRNSLGERRDGVIQSVSVEAPYGAGGR